MRAVVSVLWSMTIDCYLWGSNRNSGRAGRGSRDVSIAFSCDGDVKSVAGLLDKRTVVPCILPNKSHRLYGSLDNSESSNLKRTVD